MSNYTNTTVPPSKSQRRKIYLEAAKYLSNNNKEQNCFCGFIDVTYYSWSYDYKDTDIDYPEYGLFKTRDGYWFEDMNDRIMALLFAAEMCN